MTITYLPTESLVKHRYALVSHALIESMGLNEDAAVFPLGIHQLKPQVHLYPYLLDTHQLSYAQTEQFWHTVNAYPLGQEIYPECYCLFNLREDASRALLLRRLHDALFYPRLSPEMILRYYDPRVMVPFSVLADLPHPQSLFLDEAASMTYYLDGTWKTQALNQPLARTAVVDTVVRQSLPLISLINAVLGELFRDGIAFVREEACLSLFLLCELVKSRYGVTHNEDLNAVAYCHMRYGEAVFRHQAVLNLLYHAKLQPRLVEEGLRHLIRTNQLSPSVQGASNVM